MAAFGWKLKGDGHRLAPGEVVAPDERLSWGKTVGLGAQHVVAMFGATALAPILMDAVAPVGAVDDRFVGEAPATRAAVRCSRRVSVLSTTRGVLR